MRSVITHCCKGNFSQLRCKFPRKSCQEWWDKSPKPVGQTLELVTSYTVKICPAVAGGGLDGQFRTSSTWHLSW